MTPEEEHLLRARLRDAEDAMERARRVEEQANETVERLRDLLHTIVDAI